MSAHPPVVGSGTEAGHEWMATRRLPGKNLAAAWAGLDHTSRKRALTDLCRRVLAVGDTDVSRLPRLSPTPIYALNQPQANAELAAVADVFDTDTGDRLRTILDEGFDAIPLVPSRLVHTDTGPHNAIWDGRSAVPVDFEFATIGPADLDVDGLCRGAVEWDKSLLSAVVACLRGPLQVPGAAARLRAYAVLRDLWGLGKWIINAPERRNIDTWRPTRQLRAHAYGSNWVANVITLR